jgi:hypothetical protein
MAEKPMSPEELQAALASLLGELTGASTSALETLAQEHAARAERLAGAEARLSARLGADHPQTVAARQAAASAVAAKTNLQRLAVREASRPAPKPNEWVVFGRVLDADGNPIGHVRVRVFDRDRKYDDLLGDTTTDEQGGFSVVYHERDFLEAGEGLPELYVRVDDAQGNELYSSRDSVRAQAGRAEYFEIVLAEKAPEAGPAPKPRAARPAKKTAAKARKRKG